MIKHAVSLLIFILPSFLSRWLLRLLGYHIGKHCRIGFSWLCNDKIELGDNVRIGHFNYIKTPSLTMGKNARIKRFNAIKGNFDLKMGADSVINTSNKITNSFSEERVEVILKQGATVGVSHVMDATSSIFIGENSILAGCHSQVWTHGFYHSKRTSERWRIGGGVRIGDNVYVGSGAIICAGVDICNNCTLGAGVVVSKDLTEEGLYVNQALRFIEFDPDEAIKEHKKISDGFYEK